MLAAKEDPQVLDKRCFNLISPLIEEDIRAKWKLLSSTEPGTVADRSKRTSVVFGGRIVPSSSLAELKTCQGENFWVQKHLPQLWFGRTSNFLVGTHTGGIFHKLETIDVASQLLEWETTHQVELRKLTSLISELRETARRTPGGCCVLVGKGKARKATVYTAAMRSVLPDYIIKQFWR